MEQNVGALDRAVRVVIGVACLAAVLFVDSPVRWFGLIGTIPLLTALLGNCPLYTVLGLSTCPLSKKGV